MDSGPDVSIVVATYNRCAGLARLLRALDEQTYPASQFEVVVVDDGSSDATPELLRTVDVPYALRSYAQSNSGPAAARNLGVAQARGSLILFLDDDIVPAPGLVAAHVAAHGDATHTVVTGPLSPPPPAWRQPAWDRWDTMHLQEQYQAMTAGVFACTQRQFFTGNASLRRSLFDEAGGFDPRFKRAEDLELAWRMSALGARFTFEPRADGLHYSARPFRSWRRAAYLYGRYDVLMEREQGMPTFKIACREFHDRHHLNRWLTRLCIDRGLLSDAIVRGLSGVVHVADYLGAGRIASLALSNVFNVQYWQGMSDELGGAERLWQAVARHGEERLTDLRLVPAESEDVGHPAHSAAPRDTVSADGMMLDATGGRR